MCSDLLIPPAGRVAACVGLPVPPADPTVLPATHVAFVTPASPKVELLPAALPSLITVPSFYSRLLTIVLNLCQALPDLIYLLLKLLLLLLQLLCQVV